MDPLTAACNVYIAWAQLEQARLEGMTPAQREAYLQWQLDTGHAIEKGWQDFITKVASLFHPKD
jgi:hypothetical protein